MHIRVAQTSLTENVRITLSKEITIHAAVTNSTASDNSYR